MRLLFFMLIGTVCFSQDNKQICIPNLCKFDISKDFVQKEKKPSKKTIIIKNGIENEVSSDSINSVVFNYSEFFKIDSLNAYLSICHRKEKDYPLSYKLLFNVLRDEKTNRSFAKAQINWVDGSIIKNQHKVKACITKNTQTQFNENFTSYEIGFYTLINQRLFEVQLICPFEHQNIANELIGTISDSFIRLGKR